MRQRQILFNAFIHFILHSCWERYVSGLAISDMGDLVIGTRSKEWSQTYCKGMEDQEFQRTHALFSAVGDHLRESTDAFGSRASCAPFLVRCGDSSPLITFGTAELQMAIERDFLDAGEGSTNESKGWRMNPVGKTIPTTTRDCNSHAFMDARVSFADVKAAKGTVIFNSAGAYISSTLATASLAALDGLDGLYAGVCLNMYVTRGDAKVSAPPHTDKQDVLVMQTQGRKHWKVYSPPDNRVKPIADPFARGKGADDLPLQTLEDSGSKLIFEATLKPGDVLFVPSRFPHTTDTLSCYKDDPEKHFDVDDWSIHLTVGLDSHVWSMNYLSMRRMGLLKFGLLDVLAHNENDTDMDVDLKYTCMKVVNNLSQELREHLFSSINAGDLFVMGATKGTEALIHLSPTTEKLANELFMLNKRVNAEVDAENKDVTTLNLEQCGAIVAKFCTVGQDILNTHREMYVAAVEEEQVRRTEAAWVADDNMTKGQVDRLGIFRVPKFFERLDFCRNDLQEWATERYYNDPELPIIMNGDQIEVNLQGLMNGPWSPAKVVMARSDGLFDIQFFDGVLKRGVARHAIKGPHGIGIFI
jgi:Cupin superfamily protein